MARSFYLITLSLGLSVLTCEAFAAPDEVFDSFEKDPVYCEYYLTGPLAEKASHRLREHLFEKVFIVSMVENVSKISLAHFGLQDIRSDEKSQLLLSVSENRFSPLPVTLRLQEFSHGLLLNLHKSQFPDDSPVLWNEVFLSDGEAALDYEALVGRHPFDPALSIEEVEIGFHSDPDRYGAQKYMFMRYYEGVLAFSVEIGLHVPCRVLPKYVTKKWSREHKVGEVVTSFASVCRVPVAYFTRPVQISP